MMNDKISKDKYVIRWVDRAQKVINRGKRLKTLDEVQPVKNINKNLKSFPGISPLQKKVCSLHYLQNHAYE